MSQFYDDDNADSMLKEITENLSKQVVEEMEHNQENEIDKGNETKKKPAKKLNYKKALIVVASVLVVLVIGVVVAGNYFLNRINYESDKDIQIIVDDTLDKSEVSEVKNIAPADKNVVNILLIGEEKMKDTVRGRSDSIMIATINQTQKTVKLTSLMRDCYVSIPEHGQGKLNSAYNIGGGPLLLSTIEQNFEIPLDGYARVDFDAFEAIVDKLGKVEIELTEAEANYLNVKDYISKPEYRTVKPGVQLLNGNQALGYSRVRYVAGIDGEKDDFGRTNRQRVVLNAIFEKYKTKNLFELVSIVNELLPYITTDLSKTDILSYVAAFVGTGTTELETFRLPLDNGFTNVKNNQGWVLMLNYEKNNAAFHEFIYGVATDGTSTVDDATDGADTTDTNAE